MKLKPALAAAAALCLIATTAAIAAGGKPVDSKVSLNLGPKVGQFTGVVKADNTRCVAGRKVKIIRLEPGPKQRVAKDFSDIQGLYDVRTNESSGAWIAKVKAERRGGLLCRADKSRRRAAG